MIVKKLYPILLTLAASSAWGQVSISASNVTDAFLHPLTARLCFTPVNAAEQPQGFNVGTDQIIPNEACGKVVAGVLQSGLTLGATPTGIYYHLYVKGTASNTVMRDYGMTQITGASWTLDTFTPNMATLPVSTISAGTFTPGSPGGGASCTVGGSAPTFLLNCTVPTGATGATGAAGSQGPSGSGPIAGLGCPTYNGYTDPGSLIAGCLATDLTNGVQGQWYQDNSSPGSIHLGPYGFFPTTLTTPAPGLPQTTSGVLKGAPGVTYSSQGEIDVPWEWAFLGEASAGGDTSVGSVLQPDASHTVTVSGSPVTLPGFAMHPFGTDTALVTLGCLNGTTGNCFSIGSQVQSWNISGLGSIPGLICVTNGSTQQGSAISHNYLHGCMGGGIKINSIGTAGATQNQGPVSFNNIGYTTPTTSSVLVGGDVINAGSGYSPTAPPPVSVGGCSVAPSYAASVNSSGNLAYIYGTGQNPDGICNAPGSVTITIGAPTSGTTAAVTPIIENIVDHPGLYSMNGGGATVYDTNSVVAGAAAVPMSYGQVWDAGGNAIINSYTESFWRAGFAFGPYNAAGAAGNTIIDPKCSGANQAGLTCLEVGAGGPGGFFALGVGPNSGQLYSIMNLSQPGPRFSVLQQKASGDAGGPVAEACGQSQDGTTLCMSRQVVSNLNVGMSAYNCGSGGCSSTTAPHQYMPVTLVNGALQAMTSGTTTPPIGIALNGIFSTAATVRSSACGNGAVCPVAMDSSSVTAGDCVVLSTTVLTPIEGHDSGSQTCPSGVESLGTIIDDKTSATYTMPSAPSTVTPTVAGTAGGRTIIYQMTSGDFATSGATQSAPSSTMTVTSAPNSLGGSNGVSFAGLPSGQTFIYRTSSGDATLPSGTFYVDANGHASYMAVGSASGPDALFPPGLVFSGGNCTVYPTAKASVSGGYWTGGEFQSLGTCTPNTSGTVTATSSTYETGLIKATNGGSTFTDYGSPGDSTVTAPTSGRLAPNVFISIKPATSAVAGVDAPLSLDGSNNVQIPVATNSQGGYMSAADHTTFSGLAAGGVASVNARTGAVVMPFLWDTYLSTQTSPVPLGFWETPVAITITHFNLSSVSLSNLAGCTTAPTVNIYAATSAGVTSGSPLVTLTESNGARAWDSGVLSVSVSANTYLVVNSSNNDVGCTGGFGAVTAVVQYQ